MAALTITAASVLPGSNAVIDKDHNAGATITAGQPVYLDSTTNEYLVSDADAAGKGTVDGIALNAASDGQPLAVQTGGNITIGATVAVGTSYVLGSTAGAINPNADATSTWVKVHLGVATSTTVIALKIQNSGATIP